MKKKLISFLFSLLLFGGLTLNAAAAEFEITSESTEVKVGEKITVTVVLDETIPVAEQIMAVQGELYYDTELFSYVTHKMGDEYSQYMSQNAANKDRLQFSNISMMGTPYEVSAGNVLTVVFEAKEDFFAEDLEAVFRLEMTTATVTAQTNKSQSELKVKLKDDDTSPEKPKDEDPKKEEVSQQPGKEAEKKPSSDKTEVKEEQKQPETTVPEQASGANTVKASEEQKQSESQQTILSAGEQINSTSNDVPKEEKTPEKAEGKQEPASKVEIVQEYAASKTAEGESAVVPVLVAVGVVFLTAAALFAFLKRRKF